MTGSDQERIVTIPRITFVLAVLASGVLATGLAGCSRESGEVVTAADTVVYFDTATRQTISLPQLAELPAAHPETGRRTLVRARYCSQCDQWHASPPLDVLQRDPRARNCPQCGKPVTNDRPADQSM